MPETAAATPCARPWPSVTGRSYSVDPHLVGRGAPVRSCTAVSAEQTLTISSICSKTEILRMTAERSSRSSRSTNSAHDLEQLQFAESRTADNVGTVNIRQAGRSTGSKVKPRRRRPLLALLVRRGQNSNARDPWSWRLGPRQQIVAKSLNAAE